VKEEMRIDSLEASA